MNDQCQSLLWTECKMTKGLLVQTVAMDTLLCGTRDCGKGIVLVEGAGQVLDFNSHHANERIVQYTFGHVTGQSTQRVLADHTDKVVNSHN